MQAGRFSRRTAGTGSGSRVWVVGCVFTPNSDESVSCRIRKEKIL